jgi:putative spermidine/putrescine transport system permease protein
MRDRAPRIDRAAWLALPAVIFVLAVFILPFAYGLILSFAPKEGGAFANYIRFFSQPSFYNTVGITLGLALPATIINVALSVPMAYRLRYPSKSQRLVTALLVVPITLGTVLIADGLLAYLGPQGWVNRILLALGMTSEPVRLVHNYTGVLLSLIISGFPFTFLLTLSYITGVDPNLPNAARTLGASPWRQFREIYLPLLLPGLAVAFCLTFVQAFSVFPSAVLLGAPAGPTRVISIAAWQSAYEDYDYAMASAVAMLMGAIQLGVTLVVLGGRRLLYRGPVVGGKG